MEIIRGVRGQIDFSDGDPNHHKKHGGCPWAPLRGRRGSAAEEKNFGREGKDERVR